MTAPEQFLIQTVIPATDWLTNITGREVGGPAAHVMLLAIAIQETNLLERRQVLKSGGYGLGHGWWQCEPGPTAAIGGLMRHPATAKSFKLACIFHSIPWDRLTIHEAITWHDPLAAVVARLLLYSDPTPLPLVDAADDAWAYYLRHWRPGTFKDWRPGAAIPERWKAAHRRALTAVVNVHTIPEKYGDLPVAKLEHRAPTPDEIATYLAGHNVTATTAMAPSVQEITVAAAQREAVQKRSLTVTASDGQSVSIDPPQPMGTFRRGSGAIIIVGLLLTLGEVALSYQSQTLAAFQAHDWGTLAGIALVVIPLALQKWDNKQQYLATSKVAMSKLDPMVAAATPVQSLKLETIPAPPSPAADHSEVLAEIRDALRQQNQAA